MSSVEPTGHTVENTEPGKRRFFGGLLVCCMLLASLVNGVTGIIPAAVAGVFAWAAALVLLDTAPRHLRIQAAVLAGIGALCFFAGHQLGASKSLLHALTVNQAIVSFLAAVSFIRIVGEFFQDKDEILPTGKPAIVRTLLGTALTGAAINMSAIIIVGDRIGSKGKLSRLQSIVMSRAFASTAFWSPLFISVATALSYAPGASLLSIFAIGLPLGVISLALTLREVLNDSEAESFKGYPTHRTALILPLTLAAGVVITHQLAPGLSVIALISILALSLSLGLATWHFRQRLPERLRKHVGRDLGGMSGELLLFLSAGLFAVGIATLAQGLGFKLTFEQFTATEASIVVATTTLSGVVGLHPIIGVSLWSGFLLPLEPSMNLLAISFVMAWAGGVAISPLSGLHMFIQGRFGTPAHSYLRWSARYSILMLIVNVIALHLFERLALIRIWD